MLIVADLFFKNNRGVLRNCVICENGRKGTSSIQDKEEVETIIERENEMFFFQNRCANGQTSICNIEGYSIREISKKDF